MDDSVAASLLFKCENCGSSFSDPYRFRKYCCRACYRQHGNKPKRSTRKDFGTKKASWSTLECYQCGASFERRTSEVRQGKAQFCSRDCYKKTGNAVVMSLSDSRFGRKRVREGGLGFHPNTPDTIRNKQYGEPNSWSADRGYVLYYWVNHPASSKGGRILEHRAIAYEIWGDAIKGMHVDHINGNKKDNRPENLQLLAHSQHAKKTGKQDGVAALATWVRETYPNIYDEWVKAKEQTDFLT